MNKIISIFLISILTIVLACSNTRKNRLAEDTKCINSDTTELTKKFKMKKYIIPEELKSDSQLIVDNLITLLNWWDTEDNPNFNSLLNESDILLAGRLQKAILNEKNFQFLNDPIFYERINDVFGIDLKSSNKYLYRSEYFTIYAKLYSLTACEELNSKSTFLDSKRRKNYTFFNQFKFFTSRLPLSIDYLGDASDEDSKIRLQISEEDFHENNFILNNSKSSLTWLLINDFYFIEDLFYEFGYDKDPSINKFILESVYNEYKDSPTKHNENALYDIFIRKDCNGKLHIKENLYQFISSGGDNENDYKYVSMMYDYARFMMYDNYALKNEMQLTKDERLKIATYLGYYIELYYAKYQNPEDINYFPVEGAYTGSFYRNQFVDDKIGLIEYIQKNNYFNLPGLKGLIESVNNQIITDTEQYYRSHPNN